MVESIGRRRTLRSSLEKGRKRPAAFFLVAALYQVLIQKWKQPKIKGWSFLKHTLIAGLLPFWKKTFSQFYFHNFFFRCRDHNFFPLPRPTEWRPMTFTHQVYFNSRPLGDALTRELALELGGATSLDFVHCNVCKQKRMNVEWNSFWHGLHVLKRKEVKLRFLTLVEKLLCEHNFSLHYSWQAS